MDSTPRRLRVAQLMSSPAATARARDSLKDAVTRMLDQRVGSLVVLDDRDELVGILTRSDVQVRTRRIPRGFPQARAPRVLGEWVGDIDQLERAYRDAGSRRVGDAMSAEVITTTPDASAWDATEVMLAEGIGHLPVVDAGRLVGMLSRLDLLRCMLLVDED